jgi:hypothetical protein
MKNSKFNKWIIGLVAFGALLAVSAARAQGTSTTSVSSQLPPLPLTPPAGAVIPAFNTNGLSFTNADYKAATGSHFDSDGGVLPYLQVDADLYSLGTADLGLGANATLSGTGTGLHTLGGFAELLKNFNNFQLAGKVGGGFQFDAPRVPYVAEVLEINYNLSGITSGFLAGNHIFTFVGANVEFDEGHFQTGSQFEKQFDIYTGISF